MSLSKQFYESHIKDLNEKLEEIYTIKTPEGYTDYTHENTINVKKELDDINMMETLYSAVEMGTQQGSIYEKYSKYLANVRSVKKFLERVLEDIEKEHLADIHNIEILIKTFQEHLN
jgi:hypothetical protein